MFQGTLLDGTVIDDTYPRDNPLMFRLGGGQVIKGLEDGLVGMCIGEIRNLTIPASMAYGTTGIPPLIPPNAILLIKIELVKIKKLTDWSQPKLETVPEDKIINSIIEPSDETNVQYGTVGDGTNPVDLADLWVINSNNAIHPDYAKVIIKDNIHGDLAKALASIERSKNSIYHNHLAQWGYKPEESVANDKSLNREHKAFNIRKQPEVIIESEIQTATEDETFSHGSRNNEL